MAKRAAASGSSRDFRRMSLVLAAMALIVAGSPVRAERTAPADRVNLTLSGDVVAACNLGGGGGVDLGELRGGVGFSANLGLSCNVPFDLTLRSANGGLTHERLPSGEGPFAGTLGYRLKISVPLTMPGRTSMGGEFSSAELRATRSISSGSGIAAGGATLLWAMTGPSARTQQATGTWARGR